MGIEKFLKTDPPPLSQPWAKNVGHSRAAERGEGICLFYGFLGGAQKNRKDYCDEGEETSVALLFEPQPNTT